MTAESAAGAQRALATDPAIAAAPPPAVSGAGAPIGSAPTGPLALAREGQERRAPRRVLPGTGRAVHPVALFGSTFGWSVQEAAAHAILDAFALGGGNLLQTSEHHAAGESERMIGRWLASRELRDHMLLSSSIGRSVPSSAGPAALVTAAETTLQRLGTDRIDLLMLYGAGGQAELENLLAAAERLVAAGKAIAVGGGDFSGVHLLQARIAAGLAGAPLLSTVQATYNLVQREAFEREFPRLVQVQQLGVMPKHALANGYLTGAYRDKEHALRSERGIIAFRHHDRRAQRILNTVEDLAEDHGVEPATIAIAWLLTRPNVVAPVVSAGSVRHVAALLAANQVRLSGEQLAQLERASR